MGAYQAMVNTSKEKHRPNNEPLTETERIVMAITITDLSNTRWAFRSCVRMMIVRLNEIEQRLAEAKKAMLEAKRKAEPQS